MQTSDINSYVHSNSAASDEPWRMPFRRILVGLDVEGSSSSAVSLAFRIARVSGSELVLLNSEPAPPVSGNNMAVYEKRRRQTLTATESRIREMLVELYSYTDVPYVVEVRIGSPTECLSHAAVEFDADMIIVGSHGNHGFERLLLGSVSESLVSRTTCPVMILGPECLNPPAPLGTILMCSSLEDADVGLGQYAEALAGGSVLLVLMHVIAEKPEHDPAMRAWIEDNCRTKLLSRLLPQAKKIGQFETCLCYGQPAEEILATAHSKGADLLILGAGQHGPLGDHSPWRTLAAIVRDSPCPVLNVSADAKPIHALHSMAGEKAI